MKSIFLNPGGNVFSFDSNSEGCIVILQNVWSRNFPCFIKNYPACFHAACKKFKQSRLGKRPKNDAFCSLTK